MKPARRFMLRAALLAVAAAAVLIIQPVAMLRTAGAAPQLDTVNGAWVIAGEALVKYRDKVPSSKRQQMNQQMQADRDRPIGSRGARHIHSSRYDTGTLLAFLRNDPDVEYAEPNYVASVEATPNDTSFGQLWGLLNTGQKIGVNGTPGADIEATLAWNISTGSAANIVAVIDTGVDYNHPDLAANMWSAPMPFTVSIAGQNIQCAAGTHGFNAITKTCDPMDNHGHGTHVAGTIGAVGNNGVGVAGVNWTASIMAAKSLGATGTGTAADAIDAIEFVLQAAAATGANVKVLNNSWTIGGFSQALYDQINKPAARAMLFVASAGNTATGGVNNDVAPHYPSSYDLPHIISVASTDNQDKLGFTSNYGATSVDLGAPGVNILSTVLTTAVPAYQFMTGTSMAAPHVAGAAALVLSRCDLDVAELKANLLSSVDAIPVLTAPRKVATGGRLNVNTAIRACYVPPDFSITVTPGTQSATGSSAVYTVTLDASGGFSGTVALSVSGLPTGTTASFDPPSVTVPGSSTLTVTADATTPAGTYPLDITGTSDTIVHVATVTFTNNHLPVGVDDTVTTPEDTAVIVPVLANDTDADGDPLTVTAVGAPLHGGAAANPDGTITYTPQAEYSGPDAFTYTIVDSRGGASSETATVTVTVTAVNDAPVATGQSVSTNEDTAKPITLAGSDTEGAALTFVVVAGPANGTLSGTAPALTYTPALNYSGPDSFTFTANDGTADSNVATVAITVAEVNDAPVASDQTVATDEDAAKAIILGVTDVEVSPLTYTVVTAPAHGALTGTAPALTYTPTANYGGPDSFTFKANDGAADSNVATVSIAVTGVNDAPVATGQTLTTDEDTATAITLAGSDVEGTSLTYAIVAGPTHGMLSGTAPTLTYTPAADYGGPDSFTFNANDGDLDSTPATVSITVTGVNDAPTATGQVITTAEDTSTAITLSGSDTEGAPLTFTVVAGPTQGTLSGTAPALTYSPAANYSGPDSFTFTANDGAADSNVATVSIAVTGVNDAPVAAGQTITTNEDTPAAITLAGSDAEGALLTYAIVAVPAHGMLSGTAPTLTYTPAANYNGPDSFTFKASDGTANSNVATVSITVNSVVDDGPGMLAVDNMIYSDGSGTRTTPPFSTSTAQTTLIAFAASDGPAAGGQTLTVTGGGLSWSLVRRINAALGTSEIWRAFAPAGLSNVQFRSTQAVGGFHQSLTVVAFSGAAGIGATATASASTGAPALSLVTTQPGSLLYAVGNDWYGATARTLDAGQTMVHQWVDSEVQDTFWVQRLAAPVAAAGTRVQLGVLTPLNHGWNFAAIEIVSAAPRATVPDVVSLTQDAATAAISSAGLTAGAITTAASTTVPAGSVVSQNPAGGTQVVEGTAVGLIVSSGPSPAAEVVAVETVISADGRGTQKTAAFSTSASGQLLLAFAASDGSAVGGQMLTVSGGGLVWTLVHRANAQAGTAEIWKATAQTPLSNVTVTSTQAQSSYDQSLTVVSFIGATGIGASATQSAPTGAPQVTLTTTKAGALIYGVGNDWDSAIARTVGAGQTMVHEWVDAGVGDTFWVQAWVGKIETAGTSVRLSDTAPTWNRWNFAAVEVVR